MSEQIWLAQKYDSLKFLLKKNWFALLLLGTALVLLAVLIPRLTIWWALYWSSDSWKRLFYEDLGLSDASSEFLATILSFVYVFAWVPLAYLSWKRYNAKKFALLFVCWVLVEGTAPALHAIFGNDICFNQATGQPEKWYVVRNGAVELFDSPGYDAFGSRKAPVTRQICNAAYAEQHTGSRPNLITGDPRNLEFFDPNTGLARVWFDVDSEGKFRLFDAPGFDPSTDAPLQPITRDVVPKILSAATEAEKKAEAGPTISPSFDCSATVAPIPKLICTTPSLAEADNEMAAAYTTALSAVPDSQALRQSQRDWLKMRNASPVNADLVLQQLNERTAYLRNVAQNAITNSSQPALSTSDSSAANASDSVPTDNYSDSSTDKETTNPSQADSTATVGIAPAYMAPMTAQSYSRPTWRWGYRAGQAPPQRRGFFQASRPAFVRQRSNYARPQWQNPRHHR